MPMSTFKQDLDQRGLEQFVKDQHFGVNYVAGTNFFGNGNSFEDIVTHLGGTGIRYPGGTVTEQYFDPGSRVWRHLFEEGRLQTTASDGRQIEGPGRLFEYASRNDIGVQFVLPTSGLIKQAPAGPTVIKEKLKAVETLVTDLLEGKFGNARIDQIEIGNEYYHYAGLDAEEYGLVASELIGAVYRAIRKFKDQFDLPNTWEPPKIAVQAGAGWRLGDNEKIIEGLGNKAINLVDSVIFHYYPSSLDEIGTRDRHLDQIEDWRIETGNPDLDFFVSEWNIYGHESDKGMAHASTLIAGLATLIEKGVNSATIWGAHFRWLDSGLSTSFNGQTLEDADSRLSVSGELFAMMSESLVGMELFEVSRKKLFESDSEQGEILVKGFGDSEKAVIFFASRSAQEIDIDFKLDSYFGEVTHIWGESLTSVDDPRTTWSDESSPLAVGGIPDLDILNHIDFSSDDGVTLSPYQVLRITVDMSGHGVSMQDHDPLMTGAISYDDRLVGSALSDRIMAHVGNDFLFGRAGNDALRGGVGDDTIRGGSGSDLIFGDSGNDTLIGGDGRDQISGGNGDDNLFGGHGSDIIIGGEGDNYLAGGHGDDVIIVGSSGHSTVVGGLGKDYIVLNKGSETTIFDFSFDQGDRWSFGGLFLNGDELRAAATVLNDRTIQLAPEDGPSTTFEGTNLSVDELVAGNQDFTRPGQDALDLARSLNAFSTSEIRTFVARMNNLEVLETFASLDPRIFFSSLGARAAAELLNSFESADISSLIYLVGKENIVLTLGEVGASETLEFFDTLNFAKASTLIQHLGIQWLDSLLVGLSDEDTQRLETKLIDNRSHRDFEFDKHAVTSNPGKIVRGSAESNHLVGTKRDDVLFGGSGTDMLSGGSGSDWLKGQRATDNLVGGPGSDTLEGGKGQDHLEGNWGSDWLRGGTQSDGILGQRGSDHLEGQAGKDLLQGGHGRDMINGGSGNDRVFGGAHDDELAGGSGEDTVFGDSGDDRLFGGKSSDRLEGGVGADLLHAGNGSDRLYGNGGSDELFGGKSDDRLLGGKGRDMLIGNVGEDVLNGGRGSDLLDGGTGNDILIGGLGADLFVFKAQGEDRILDFEIDQDKIAVSSSDFIIHQRGDHAVIKMANDSRLVIHDIEHEDLALLDSIFCLA